MPGARPVLVKALQRRPVRVRFAGDDDLVDVVVPASCFGPDGRTVVVVPTTVARGTVALIYVGRGELLSSGEGLA